MNAASVALAVKIVADAKKAAADINKVSDSTSRMGKVGKAAGRLLAAGLLVAAGAAVKATQAAADDEAGQAKLASALKNATGARAKDIAGVETWIAAQGKALGVADDQLRPAMESLVTATKDVGKAQELASTAMDISARKGVSLESVAKALAKAQATGNVGALAKYGVATKDAQGKTLSLEKVQKNLAATYKGAASASAETAAGKQKRLQVAMGELQEEIGAKLLPVLLKAAEYGLKVVDWLSKNQTAAAAILGTLGGLLAIIKLVSLATTIWSTATKVAAAAQAIFNAVMAANPVVLIVIAVVALAAALVIAYKRSETFRNIVNKAFGAIQSKVSAVVGFIKGNWQKMLAILTGPIGIAVLLIIKHRDKIQAAFLAAVGWVRDKWSAIKDLLAGPIGKAKDLIGTAVDKIKTAIEGIKTKADEISGKVKGFLETAFSPISTAIGWVQDLIDKIASLIEKIKSIPTPDIPFVRTSNGSNSNGTRGIGDRPRGGATITNVFHIYGVLDGNDAAKKVDRVVTRRARALGMTA